MKTKQQRKNEAFKEYNKIVHTALGEYEKKCEEIENEN